MADTTHTGSRSPARRVGILAAWVLGVAAVAGLYGETIHFALWEKSIAQLPPQPAISNTRPLANAADVLPNAFVACDVFLPHTGHGVETASMTNDHVKLFKVAADGTRTEVPGHANTSGAGDSIVFQPTDLLACDSTYVFEEHGARDTSDSPQAEFLPFHLTFHTVKSAALSSYPVAFDKFALPNTAARGIVFTGITIGPDHRVYVGSFTGEIYRYDIAADGSLVDEHVIRTVLRGNQGRPESNAVGNRLITNLTFDPQSTPQNPILWVSSGFMALEHCPDWTSKISRLSGPNLENYQDYVVGLPRAWRDHLVFKICFLPDGTMLFDQGSNSSTGAADNKWGLRDEHLLNAATLQMDPVAIGNRLAGGQGPLNVKTEDDGKYNPWAPDAPVKLYATGVRCGFGLLRHSNGHIYAALNGGAAGGQAPGTPDSLSLVPHRIDQDRSGPYNGPAIPAIGFVSETQADLFVDIVKGGYYGHPNSARGEYVLNGGNPDGGSDSFQVHDYPVGTQPDRNWHKPIWNLGMSPSCNGLIEYKGDFFNGALAGKILTTRYSGGKDIYVLEPQPGGSIRQTVTGIDGFTQFIDPLDLVEDTATGNLYVSEFGGQRLTLLKPRVATAGKPVSSDHVFVQKPPGAKSTVALAN